MTYEKELSIASGILFLLGFSRYIIAILRGETKPTTVSWLIWAPLDYVLIWGMYQKGTVNWQIVAAVIGVTTVALLSLRYGKPGWSVVDKLCLAGGIVGVILGAIMGDSIWTIMVILIVIFLGGIPTWVSAYEHPEREDRTAWVILLLSCIAAILAIKNWTWEEASQPVSFLISEIIMVVLLFWPREKEKIEEPIPAKFGIWPE